MEEVLNHIMNKCGFDNVAYTLHKLTGQLGFTWKKGTFTLSCLEVNNFSQRGLQPIVVEMMTKALYYHPSR